MYTKALKDLSRNDTEIAGGKAASLGEMLNANLPVPNGFVVTTSAFDQFLKETDLLQDIRSEFNDVDRDAIHTVEEASENIQQLILNQEIPKEMVKEFINSFDDLGTDFVAVRSSATSEDGKENAWAGQLDSYLNITKENLVEHIQSCWASLFTPRAIFYRFEKGLQDSDVSVAVVVQKMVNAEKSGIAFSVHPVTEDFNQLIIEAGFGLGEAIVSGQITPDSYVVSKKDESVIDVNVCVQKKALYRGIHENEWRELGDEGEKQVLEEDEVLALSKLVVAIESHYDCPQDVEWAYESGDFYITQSRPITTLQNINKPIKQIGEFVRYHFDDFKIIFEAKGLAPLFQDILAKGYLAEDLSEIFAAYKNGTLTAYWSHDVIDQVKVQGLKFYSEKNFAKQIVDTCDTTFKKIKDIKNALEKKDKIEKEDVDSIFEEYNEFFSQYRYLDTYVDGAFSYAYTNKVIEENMEVVMRNKNLIREFVNETFFSDKGLHSLLLLKLEEQFEVSVNDLNWYLIHEVQDLFEGCRLDDALIKKRKKAYIFHKGKTQDSFFYGDEADKLIKNFLETKNNVQSDILQGIVAHKRGVEIQGSVRIIHTDYADLKKLNSEMESMKEGEILVSETTAPELMPAIRKASAIITDMGGMLSHAAITARELDIPCVIDTQKASKVLSNGEQININLVSGLIQKSSRD